MTPKEKSKNLCNRYLRVGMMIERAKECALVCVDEILKSIKKDSDFTITYDKAVKYWSEVKEEINKL
jgi:hypothetical protein